MSKRVLGAAVLACVMAGCAESAMVTETVVAEQVFLHETGHITALVPLADGHIGQLELRGVLRIERTAEAQTRVEYRCRCVRQRPTVFSQWSIGRADITVRLGAGARFEGGGWNHGKFGSGQTVVLP